MELPGFFQATLQRIQKTKDNLASLFLFETRLLRTACCEDVLSPVTCAPRYSSYAELPHAKLPRPFNQIDCTMHPASIYDSFLHLAWRAYARMQRTHGPCVADPLRSLHPTSLCL